MRRVAWIYVIFILLFAFVLSIIAFMTRDPGNPSIWVFLTLTLITTFMRMFHIVAPDHRSYEGSTIAFVIGFLLFPSWVFVLQVVISQSIEWVWVRMREPGSLRAWYLQPFNMAKCIIGGIMAQMLGTWVSEMAQSLFYSSYLTVILVMMIAYVAINQLILGLALLLARGISFREAGIFRDAILLELPLACIGYVSFELYNRNPITVIFVLAPIVLIYQVFMLPKVQDEAMKALENMNRDLTEANQSIRRLNDELFQTLAKVFDMRDPFVGGHAAQVAVYAVAIATEMGLPQERIELVRQAAFLHDIGKLAIPEAILHKQGKLNEPEYEYIKRHSDIGADLLASTEGLQHLAPLVRHHHERWDGIGYPLGLAGEEIPLEARILSVCDAIEAMASDRPYHRSLSTEAIIRELRRCAGTHFDPLVTEVFINLVEKFGSSFVVNSARSVSQQYAATILAHESLKDSLFAWALEAKTQNQIKKGEAPAYTQKPYEVELRPLPQLAPGNRGFIHSLIDI